MDTATPDSDADDGDTDVATSVCTRGGNLTVTPDSCEST